MARILLVDDDPAILNLVGRILEGKGHAVETARDAREGLVKASPLFDLVVTDVLMPGMDGWDFVRVLRSWPETALIPVVFLTALDGSEDRIKGYGLGADDYVAKPFNAQELALRVERLLERSRGLRQVLKARFQESAPAIKGSLRQTGVSTVLNILDMEKSTGELVFTHGDETARLAVRDGRVIRARVEAPGGACDEDCVYALLEWSDGDFAFFPKEAVDGHDALRRPTTVLLMEAARRADEAGR